ncbi:MAG: hypothetical protein DME18_09045, partial [Verrucomicrobia bacterium]
SPRAEEASHIFFCNGIEDDRIRLTSTHPPLDERIKRIQTMMGESFVPEPKPMEEHAAGRSPDVGFQEPEAGPRSGSRFPSEPVRVADEPEEGTFVKRLSLPGVGAAKSSAFAGIDAKLALANVGVPVARHLVYAAELMEALPEPVRRATRDPRRATALIYVLLLSPVESVREAQLRLLKSRLSSEACLNLNTFLSHVRDLNELIKIPLVELTFAALRRMSLPEYAAFMENTSALIAADRQVDLFEFALRKMLHRHLEPKFKPVPKPDTRHTTLGELSTACSTLLSALAHTGQDTTQAAQTAFERAVHALKLAGGNIKFLAMGDCTFNAIEAALDDLAEAAAPLKKLFLDACAQTVAADGRIRPREAELLRAIADALDCPIPPFVSRDVCKTT